MTSSTLLNHLNKAVGTQINSEYDVLSYTVSSPSASSGSQLRSPGFSVYPSSTTILCLSIAYPPSETNSRHAWRRLSFQLNRENYSDTSGSSAAGSSAASSTSGASMSTPSSLRISLAFVHAGQSQNFFPSAFIASA